MSGGCSSFTFPQSSSTSLSNTPSRRQSHLPVRGVLNSYRICSHAAFHLNLALSAKRRRKARDTRIRSSILPDVPPLPSVPSGPPPGQWKTWMVGTVVALLLSFVKTKWTPLLKLKDEFGMAVKTADRVAEVLEKVAEEVEKVADAVADHTPANSKVHAAAVLLEKVAKEVARDAHLADVALDKVEEVEEEVERDVESLIEPILNFRESRNTPKQEPKEPDS